MIRMHIQYTHTIKNLKNRNQFDPHANTIHYIFKTEKK